MKPNIIRDKTYQFSIRIINLYLYLKENKSEFVLSKQILRCGTSIGANVSESQDAQSKADFKSKLNIALKEARETLYWLSLLKDTNFIDEKMFSSMYVDGEEIIKLSVTIIKNTK